jgi:hypothetical protein
MKDVEKKCDLPASESDDSLNSMHTAIDYEIPDGFYLTFSENEMPWILPNTQTNLEYIIEKLFIFIIKQKLF